MDFIIRGNKTLVAIGVAAIARVVQKFKQMRAKLDESKKALESLEGQVEMLASKNTAMETQRDVSASSRTHFSPLPSPHPVANVFKYPRMRASLTKHHHFFFSPFAVVTD